jgi:DNA-binding FrmR family transcriptional regulator
MIPEHKQKALIAVKKAHTHLGKVLSMIEQDAYCIDIMQQVLAVQGLLKSVNDQMMCGHFRTCFCTAMAGKNEKRRESAIGEVMRIFRLSEK